MRCKLVLCEGAHDCCFIEPLLSEKKYCLTEVQQFNKIGAFVRRYKEKEDVWIIHDSGGKQFLYKKTKILISQLRSESPKLILILDQNNTADICGMIKNIIRNFVNTPSRFGGVWEATLMDGGNNTFKICFRNGKESRISILEVPESLEKKVSVKLEEMLGHNSTSDPHDFISTVAKKGALEGVENNCDIFKLACSDGWFRSEGWFHRLSNVFV